MSRIPYNFMPASAPRFRVSQASVGQQKDFIAQLRAQPVSTDDDTASYSGSSLSFASSAASATNSISRIHDRYASDVTSVALSTGSHTGRRALDSESSVLPSKSFTESASSDISVELHDNDNLASSLSLMSMEREGPARSSDEESGNDDDIPNGPPRRQPRSNHQHSAPQQVAGPCLLCEANMNDFAGSTGVSDVERTIVRLEKRLRGRLADEHIFARMLELRQQFVDDVLRKLGRPCTPWTVEMLRAHYHPVSGHEFDMVRQLDAELANINKFTAELQENMYIANPDTGECELDMRKHPLLKEWSKRKSAVFQERERALANLQKEADGVEQELHALRKITLQSAAIQTTPAIGAHVEQTGMQMDQAYTSAYSAACGLPLGGFDVM